MRSRAFSQRMQPQFFDRPDNRFCAKTVTVLGRTARIELATGAADAGPCPRIPLHEENRIYGRLDR